MEAGSDLKIIQYLVSHGAKLDVTDKNGWTVLSYAFQQQKDTSKASMAGETIQWLLSQPGVFINEQVLGLSSSSLGKKQLELVSSIRERDVAKVESILKEEKYLCVDARNEVS